MLPVNEVFETIQGEASFTGHPSIFVRLQGCAVGCSWCDTKHTWFVDADNIVPAADMLAKQISAPTWAEMSVGAVLDAIATFRAPHVVITGGEPCQHDLTALTAAIIDSGRSVQIETSGTQPIRCHDHTWVTLSPKIDMPGQFLVRSDALARANEIKMPIGKADDIAKLDTLLARGEHNTRMIWLQPISRSPKATKLCADTAMERGFYISVQVHELAGWR